MENLESTQSSMVGGAMSLVAVGRVCRIAGVRVGGHGFWQASSSLQCLVTQPFDLAIDAAEIILGPPTQGFIEPRMNPQRN